jgi:hypothetical protein
MKQPAIETLADLSTFEYLEKILSAHNARL